MKKILFSSLLFSALASAAAPRVILTDRSGLAWYEVDDTSVGDYDAAQSYCENHGLQAPTIDQVNIARADLKLAVDQGRLDGGCYWTQSHTAIHVGDMGYFYTFDRYHEVAIFNEWDDYRIADGCRVRCVASLPASP